MSDPSPSTPRHPSAPATVIVTGASVGIGRAVAAHHRARGHRVINLSRRPCPVAGVDTLVVDLADSAAVSAAIDELRQRLGPPSVVHLIHNAGVAPSDTADAFDVATFERTLRVNVVSPAALTSGLLPAMAAGSSIILVGSTLSEKAVPGRMSYVVSKHAVAGLLRATVQDLFGRAIHCVCVCPGFVDTEILAPVIASNPEFLPAVQRMVSFGRLIAPEEIAEVIAFATENPTLNGAILHANLGQREG